MTPTDLTFRGRFCGICLLPVLMLGGCQQMATTAPPATPLPKAAELTKNFALTGKIGVITPQQSGSAFFAWSQSGDRFAIELSGAMGLGQTRIEGVPHRYTLTSSKTGLLSADSPEALLEQATGWVAPISQLRYWIQGQPVSVDSPRELDAQGRLLSTQAQDWQARFDYAAASSALPSRLILTRTVPEGLQKVVVSIQSRQP